MHYVIEKQIVHLPESITFVRKNVMLEKTFCATCVGIDAVTVTVELDLSAGVGLHLVGLPDSAVRESLLRVITALSSYGFRIPGKRVVVNLAPADIRKEGTGYDLAIAVGLLAVSEQVALPRLGEFILVGELALDGTLREVPGALPIAVHAASSGLKGCIFPKKSALEAADIDGVEVYGAGSLADVIDILSGAEGAQKLLVHPQPAAERPAASRYNDFKFVKGQKMAKRGLEIAAAGGHNLILIGAPGSGKTFMASCLPSILPPMTRAESIETSTIYSIAGIGSGGGLMRERPFRTPHHSASLPSIIGGGPMAAPGEISLAHNGVLYLDEVVQFSRTLLDSLRQPVEDGRVTIARARCKVEYPCSFMLIASMNPCPCGYCGDGTGRCNCSRSAIENYRARLSGPMMDRLDMHIFVKGVDAEDLVGETLEEPSEKIAERVARARRIQEERFARDGIFTNSQMTTELIRRHCEATEEQKKFLKAVIKRLNLSARSYNRILKLARTIADLEGNNLLSLQNISEALQFRGLDRMETND